MGKKSEEKLAKLVMQQRQQHPTYQAIQSFLKKSFGKSAVRMVPYVQRRSLYQNIIIKEGELNPILQDSAKKGMKKNAKKVVTAMAACALIGAMAVGGTMAYLTDSETATNTFTVGKVQIDLEEPGYAALQDAEKKDLVPNQIVTKDPQVENTGNNEALVFLKVEMPKKSVIVAEKNGTRGAEGVTELFDMLHASVGDDDAQKWFELKGDETGTDNNIHVYAYKEKLAAGAKTDKLFDSVQLKNVIEGQVDTDTENIKITAYAIQASEVLEGANTDLTDDLTKENLQKIYDIYGEQNKDQTAPDAM